MFVYMTFVASKGLLSLEMCKFLFLITKNVVNTEGFYRIYFTKTEKVKFTVSQYFDLVS